MMGDTLANLAEDSQLLVERTRAVTDLPVGVGLGVSTPEQAAEGKKWPFNKEQRVGLRPDPKNPVTHANRARIEGDLAALVAVPSITGDEFAVQDMVAGILDEIGALLMSGEVDPLTTGMMLCELVCAAQGLALYDMASEWTDAMKRWGHDAAFGGLHGRCRVHRAEMLRVSGPCDAAEDEALAATCVGAEPTTRPAWSG